MEYLTANTADQTLYLSLDEGRNFFDTEFTHYLVIITKEENSNTGVSLAQVVTVVSEIARITEITLTTVSLTQPGRYRYEVYGQNSSSNIDPLNAAVVGIVERGLIEMSAEEEIEYYDVPETTIPDDISNG